MLGNYTSATQFYLVGFPGSEKLRRILFATFCFFYLVSLVGNTVIIAIVCADKRLQSPMYFFLVHLSILEILLTTVIVPVMLWGLLLPGMQAVSLAGCVAQLFLQLALGTTEFSLLAVMAVDRYVAVCNPLRYNVIMNSQTCNSVVIASWVFGFLYQIWPVYATFHLTYCKSNVVDNFFCDRGQLLKLSCDDTVFIEFILFLMAVFVLFGSLIPTIVSYTYIVSTILKISSASGRKKAFSTCASHFTCVVIGYGCCLFLYVKPKQTQAADYNRVVSVMISILTPFLNPFIFTLRNDKVIEALRDGVKCCYQLFKS
ncbi:olfactory receptor 9A4 [Cricetulus griseus]|uniref:Olfactory receptor n=1 Tax=Cricetulus griseus TaxID=10029 RepID=G3HU93_CRIGR|nr:olfactory receptor 9A4 [Cricetulus griseus]XP_027245511.1 olfactory receptor 9A4 [Cricetulus griseus]EGW08980.1 Olfactory receptor 9A4 [Cricetulus griseus]ERE90163.1 olfactory receptor 9A4-like protein [Cricetulus griseus]